MYNRIPDIVLQLLGRTQSPSRQAACRRFLCKERTHMPSSSAPPASPERGLHLLTAKERSDLAVEILKISRSQDDLVHGWARTLMVTQGAEALALGVLWMQLAGQPLLQSGAAIAVVIAGILTCWVCIGAAISDLQWQGKYASYVREIDPTGVLFPDAKLTEGSELPPPRLLDRLKTALGWRNLGNQAKRFYFLRIGLYSLWVSAAVVAIANMPTDMFE